MCKLCESEKSLLAHCGEKVLCGWAVCKNCGATSDVLSEDPGAFFEKKPHAPRS